MLSPSIDLDASVVFGQSIYLQICEMCDAVSKLNPVWGSMDGLMKFDQVCLFGRSASPWMDLQLIVQATETCSTLFIQKKKRPVSNERLKATMHYSLVMMHFKACMCSWSIQDVVNRFPPYLFIGSINESLIPHFWEDRSTQTRAGSVLFSVDWSARITSFRVGDLFFVWSVDILLVEFALTGEPTHGVGSKFAKVLLWKSFFSNW